MSEQVDIAATSKDAPSSKEDDKQQTECGATGLLFFGTLLLLFANGGLSFNLSWMQLGNAQGQVGLLLSLIGVMSLLCGLFVSIRKYIEKLPVSYIPWFCLVIFLIVSWGLECSFKDSHSDGSDPVVRFRYDGNKCELSAVLDAGYVERYKNKNWSIVLVARSMDSRILFEDDSSLEQSKTVFTTDNKSVSGLIAVKVADPKSKLCDSVEAKLIAVPNEYNKPADIIKNGKIIGHFSVTLKDAPQKNPQDLLEDVVVVSRAIEKWRDCEKERLCEKLGFVPKSKSDAVNSKVSSPSEKQCKDGTITQNCSFCPGKAP